jgi:meiotically up-regulated gene 157 (Mug157) protein
LAEKARAISLGIANGIKENAIFHHPIFSHVYAYEVDGYGGRIFMDDANLPSLLSLPLLGFVDKKDPVYQATREMVLSTFGNPFYLTGRQFHGIGGPHIGVRHAWPMSLLVQIMTSDDDVEIMELLNLLKTSTAGLGLMHESGMSTLLLMLMEVNVRRVVEYTRPWFAWANGLFGEMILDLIARKPELVLEKEFKHSRD